MLTANDFLGVSQLDPGSLIIGLPCRVKICTHSEWVLGAAQPDRESLSIYSRWRETS